MRLASGGIVFEWPTMTTRFVLLVMIVLTRSCGLAASYICIVSPRFLASGSTVDRVRLRSVEYIAPGRYLLTRFTRSFARASPAADKGGSMESEVSDVSFSAWRTRIIVLCDCAFAKDGKTRTRRTPTSIERVLTIRKIIKPLSNDACHLDKWIFDRRAAAFKHLKTVISCVDQMQRRPFA